MMSWYDALDEVDAAIEQQYKEFKRAAFMGNAGRIKEIRDTLATLEREHMTILDQQRTRKYRSKMSGLATLDRWSYCAEQFVKAPIDSPEAIEWYDEMLANVVLGTDYPCLTSQSETSKSINESGPAKASTLAGAWHDSRWWIAGTLAILIIFLVVTNGM